MFKLQDIELQVKPRNGDVWMSMMILRLWRCQQQADSCKSKIIIFPQIPSSRLPIPDVFRGLSWRGTIMIFYPALTSRFQLSTIKEGFLLITVISRCPHYPCPQFPGWELWFIEKWTTSILYVYQGATKNHENLFGVTNRGIIAISTRAQDSFGCPKIHRYR